MMKVLYSKDGRDGSERLASTKEDIPETMSKDRTTLLEQAKRFLEDESIRHASEEEKKTFLQSKGLTAEEADQLLSSTATSISSSATREEDIDPSPPAESTGGSQPMEPATSDLPPPIITYPEFLLHARKQQPILTTSRILATLYASSFAAAAIYGANTYVLTPMLDSLTEARHDLFDATRSNLETLNKKLEEAHTSATFTKGESEVRRMGTMDEDDPADHDSETSDPTELFHRDIGIQTSPPRSRSSSTTSLLDPEISPLERQAAKLKRLRDHLSVLVSSNNSVLQSADSLSSEMDEVRSSLEALRFPRRGDVADDEMSKVKKEIRSVKGALLSAKNFPSGKMVR